jgi:hypothetical protein
MFHTCLVSLKMNYFLKKLTVAQLIKKFLVFYGTRSFITVLTTARITSNVVYQR